MRKLFYIIYFAVIANYFIPVGEVLAMANDVFKPSYQVSSVSYQSCSSFGVGGHKDNIAAVFKLYGTAATTGGFCAL